MPDAPPPNAGVNLNNAQDVNVARDMIGGNQTTNNYYINPSPSSSYQPADLDPHTLPDPGALPPGSRVPFPRNAVFTGRTDDLKQIALAFAPLLNAQLHSGEGTGARVINALGGMGKTQLATEFCYRFGRALYGAHWVNARTLEGVDAEIAACGLAMGWPDFPATTPEQVAHTLRAWQAQPRRLVVFDNLEDPQILRQWLPRLGGLAVLVTSRKGNWDAALGLALHPLSTFDAAESLRLLRGLAPRLSAAPDADLAALAERVGHLPLALDLAGRYLHEVETLAPRAYLSELDAVGTLEHASLKNWAADNPTDHLTSLAETFLLSWRLLDATADAPARALFVACGYLAPNVAIPREVLEALVGDPRATALAVRRLKALGLLSEAPSLHPLLAEYARAQASDAEPLKAVVDKLVTISMQALDTELPAAFTSLRPHIEVLAPAAACADLEDAGVLWNNLGYHYKMVAEYPGAVSAYERALAIDERHFGSDHPNVAIRVNNLGLVLKDLSDLAGARHHYERALAIWETALGAEHPHVATVNNNLGSVLQDLGEIAEARRHFERALAIDEQSFGADHPKVAIRFNNLGLVLQDFGDLAGARSYYERALKIFRQSLPEGHPSIRTVEENLKSLPATDFETASRVTDDDAGAVAQVK